MKNKSIISSVLALAMVFLFMAGCQDDDGSGAKEVTVKNWPPVMESNFPAPDTVVVLGSGDPKVQWSVVPYAVNYVVFVRDSNGLMLNFTANTWKYASSGSKMLETVIPGNVLIENLQGPTFYYGVCAVSYDGVYSQIKWNR